MDVDDSDYHRGRLGVLPLACGYHSPFVMFLFFCNRTVVSPLMVFLNNFGNAVSDRIISPP